MNRNVAPWPSLASSKRVGRSRNIEIKIGACSTANNSATPVPFGPPEADLTPPKLRPRPCGGSVAYHEFANNICRHPVHGSFVHVEKPGLCFNDGAAIKSLDSTSNNDYNYSQIYLCIEMLTDWFIPMMFKATFNISLENIGV